MSFQEYDRYDALGLAELVRRREVTPAELLEEALARTERRNPALNAIIRRLDETARLAARDGLPDGPFTGVPFLLKDLGPFLAGVPLSMGSRATRGFLPERDSELVRRHKAAGLNIFGKTNTPEFGMAAVTEPRLWGPCRNPWALGHTPGGSSGGSAAAVAAGIVPMAHGNDGGGSLRIPASCCGLFGLKPSRGRQPEPATGFEGVGRLGIDHVLSRSVRDSAALLDATEGRLMATGEAGPAGPGGFRAALDHEPPRLRVALIRGAMMGRTVDPECRAAQDHTARRLAELGHIVEEADPPGIDFAAVTRAFIVLFFADVAHTLREVGRLTGRPVRRAEVEPACWFAATIYEHFRAGQVTAALETAGRLTRDLAEFMTRYDLMLTPTLAAPPIAIGVQGATAIEAALLDLVSATRLKPLVDLALSLFRQKGFEWVAFTPVFNMTGQPAMSVPLYWSRAGLPIGTQLAARYGEERLLFQVAAQLERAQPWFDRRPRLAEGG